MLWNPSTQSAGIEGTFTVFLQKEGTGVALPSSPALDMAIIFLDVIT